MAIFADEAYPSSATRQASTSRAFSCEKSITSDASVSAVATDTSQQTSTPQNNASSRARMCDASKSKLARSSPEAGSLQDEDEDFFHGVRGLASAVLRDLSGWVTGQFDSTSHPTSSTPPHLPKAKKGPPAVQHPEASAPHDNSLCSTAEARCSYAESAKSGSASSPSSSLMIRQKSDKRKKSEGFSLYRLFQSRDECPLGSENSDPREETVPSTRATSHSHVNSQLAFPEKHTTKISSVSPDENGANLTEVTQWDKPWFTTDAGATAGALPSPDGSVQDGNSTCRPRYFSQEKKASVPRVYEASYPGVSPWDGNRGVTAQRYRKGCPSRTERKDECSSLTILTTSMKPRRSFGNFCVGSNNRCPAALAQDRDTAAGVSPHHVSRDGASSTGQADAKTNVSRPGRNSVSSLCTGAASGTANSSGKITDDPSAYSSPQAKNSEPGAPAATSFLSSFTNSFREHFEAATKSHEKARKNTGEASSGGSSSNSATGDKRSLRTVRGAQEKGGSGNRGNLEFEVSGDWSFKPDALFASFMSIFDVDDDQDSRGGEGDALSPIAASTTPAPAVCHSRFDADSRKCVRKSPSDDVLHEGGVRQQRNWPTDISRNGGRGRNCFRNTLSTRDKVLPAKSSFRNVSSSSTTRSGASPTCTSSLIRKAACPLGLYATGGGSASDAASVRSAAPPAALKGRRYGVTTAPGAPPAPLGLARNATVTTDATFSETAEGWFGGEDLSPSELEEPADGVTHPQTWMDDAAAYTLRCVTRSHIEISVLCLHNVGKIVDASLVSGRAQYVFVQSNDEGNTATETALRCPGFNMLHLRVPFFEPETQIITLQFTTRMSRTHFALLQTLARCHKHRLLQQQQPPQQHPVQQRLHQQQNCRSLEASVEDPRWRRLLRQLRWHRRIDEDRKKDAEVKRYRVDIPVQALSKKESESRWVLLEDDDGRRPECKPPAYLAQTEEEANSSIYSPRLYIAIQKRMSGLLQVPAIAPETATTYKRPESVKFAGQRVYVGWYDDPIDGAVAETLNSHPDALSVGKNIRRLSKGRYEVDGFECRIFLGSYKKTAAQSAALATAHGKERRTDEKLSKGREKGEHVRQGKTTEGEREQQQQVGRQCNIQNEEESQQEGSERPTEQTNKNAQDGEEDATRHAGEKEEIVPIVQEGDTLQPLIDYFKGTLDNITWSPPFPTSCIELIPPRFLPPLHDTLVPWEARVERRKAMELACHRAAIREQVAAELLRLQKRPVPPLLYTKHVSPVLMRPAPGAPPVPMTYTWKEEYADVQLVILAGGPAERAASSAPQQRPQFYMQQERLFCTQQPQQADYTEQQQRHTQQWQHHTHQQNERLSSPTRQQQSNHIPAQQRQNYIG